MDNPAICNIRLSVSFKQIWHILFASSSSWIKNIDTKNNKDIILHDIDLGYNLIKTTVHRSYTVSVIIACSLSYMPGT